MAKTYSTARAAKLIGVHPITLHRWLRDKRIRPAGIPIEGRTIWRWSDKDISKGKRLKGALRPGPKRKGAKE
jgi:predicted site-specific integrase-resolvase